MFINQFVDEALQKTSYTINVLHENNVWIGLCPFCKNKKFKLQVEHGSKCNATSLKAHFRKIHPKKTEETHEQNDDDAQQSEIGKIVNVSTDEQGEEFMRQKDNDSSTKTTENDSELQTNDVSYCFKCLI